MAGRWLGNRGLENRGLGNRGKELRVKHSVSGAEKEMADRDFFLRPRLEKFPPPAVPGGFGKPLPPFLPRMNSLEKKPMAGPGAGAKSSGEPWRIFIPSSLRPPFPVTKDFNSPPGGDSFPRRGLK